MKKKNVMCCEHRAMDHAGHPPKPGARCTMVGCACQGGRSRKGKPVRGKRVGAL